MTRTRLLCSVMCIGLLASCSSGGWFGKDEKAPLPGERISVLQLQKSLEPDVRPEEIQDLQVPAPWKNEFWPQAGGYPNHSMQNVEMNSGPLTLAWKADIGDGASGGMPLTAAPIAADGKVFTVDSDQNLTAFDMNSGKQLWRADIRKKDEKDPVIGGGIAFSKGRIYATNGYDELLCLSAENGKIIWKINLPAPSRAAPTVMEDRVFVTTLDSRMMAVDAEKGSYLWDFSGIADQTAGLVGAASPAATADIVVPAFSSGEIDALLVENGTSSWSENLAGQRYASGLSSIPDIKGLPVIDRDLVLAISFGGRMIAVDQRTGNRVWQKELGSDETPWVAGNMVYVLTLNNEIVALNRNTGTILWVTQLQRFEDPKDIRSDAIDWTGPVLAGGRILIASSEGIMVEINPMDGKMVRQWKTGHNVGLPMAIAGGMLFMVSEDGTLLAYR